MKIKLKFAELQTPLFLAGTSLGVKLSVTGGRAIELFYERTEKELHVVFNAEVSVLPVTNVASMVPADPTDMGYAFGPANKPKVSLSASIKGTPKGKVKAQASHPVEDAVFGKPQ